MHYGMSLLRPVHTGVELEIEVDENSTFTQSQIQLNIHFASDSRHGIQLFIAIAVLRNTNSPHS